MSKKQEYLEDMDKSLLLLSSLNVVGLILNDIKYSVSEEMKMKIQNFIKDLLDECEPTLCLLKEKWSPKDE